MRVPDSACGGDCGDAESRRDPRDATCGWASRAVSAAAWPLFVARAGARGSNRLGGHRGRVRRRVCGAQGAAVRARAARAAVPAVPSEARLMPLRASHAACAPCAGRRRAVCVSRRPGAASAAVAAASGVVGSPLRPPEHAGGESRTRNLPYMSMFFIFSCPGAMRVDEGHLPRRAVLSTAPPRNPFLLIIDTINGRRPRRRCLRVPPRLCTRPTMTFARSYCGLGIPIGVACDVLLVRSD